MTININPNKSKTAISIDTQLLKETDSIAQELSVTRSQVVSSALDEYVRHYRNQQLLAQLNAAYADGMNEDEQQSLQIIRSHSMKPGETNEWK
jgi:metal-responsive CopG/Arc/MetJ family transcriptional regulator